MLERARLGRALIVVLLTALLLNVTYTGEAPPEEVERMLASIAFR